MKRIDVLNRVTTVLIFAIIGGLTLYNCLLLQHRAQTGRELDAAYRRYHDFERIELALENEQFATERYLVRPTMERRAAIVRARSEFFDAVAIASRASGVEERTALGRIESVHASWAPAIARSDVLRRRGDLAAGLGVYGTSFLPAYKRLQLLVEVAATANFERARSINASLQASAVSIREAMLGIGLFALVVVAGLLYTVHAYKSRANEAARHEIEQLEAAARSDSLTGLGNHRSFYEDYAREIARSRRHGHPLTLALLDIDGFKEINDTRGHQCGDEILARLATVLQAGRAEDRNYRVGGDEFAVLLVDCAPADAAVALERIRVSVAERLEAATVSIGFCGLEPGLDENDLYERADAALYEAKRRGRNNAVDFAAMHGATSIFSARKVAALRSLLEERRLDVAFQPIWDVSAANPIGYEALARPDAALGFKGPQEAFDVAERNHRIVELDCLCLTTLLERASWLPPGKLLFVNVSAETLGSLAFQIKEYTDRLTRNGLRPSQIVVEVTERTIANIGELVARLTALREAGYLVALDDTGTGHAGLEVLGSFSFDFVKIDRSIIWRAMSERPARGIIAGIVAIARESGSYVIAEGIERAEHLRFLEHIAESAPEVPAIHGAQGYLLGRPVLGEPKSTDLDASATVLRSAPEALAG